MLSISSENLRKNVMFQTQFFHISPIKLYVTVQGGGKRRAKTGIKLAYKHAFALLFTSDGHPMLLVRPWPGKKMCRPELICYKISAGPQNMGNKLSRRPPGKPSVA